MFYRHFLLILSIYGFGIIIRKVLLNSEALSKTLGNRVEISTPLNAWKRAIEGVSLRKQGTDPYDGDVFHETPLALLAYDYFISYAQEWIPFIFILADLVTATSLSLAAKIYLKDLDKRENNVIKYPSANVILLKVDEMKWIPFYSASMYLLCPYAIVSCCGKSTVVFQNMFLALFILFTSAGRWFIASLFLALSSYQTFYHLTLLFPLIMYMHQRYKNGESTFQNCIRIVAIVFTFLISCFLLMYASYKITDSWNFLWSTYGCILTVPDLTPNIGLFWYFFTEMFEHFRVFFLCTFQLNVFVYTVPLAIRLRNEPMLLLLIHLIIIAVFKSYPCIGDVAFYFAVLPMWSHLFQFMRQKFIVGCVLASCTLLAPTLWHLWIYSGSANANFYFAITLAFNTGQIFLLTDILSAFIKREYYLENGIKYTEDGRLVLLKLQ